MMKTNIKDVWNKLESSRHLGEARFKLVDYEPLNCYLSILESTNTRCFELQIDSTSLKTFEKKFKGVEIYLVTLKSNRKSLIIYLLDSDLSEIFTLFIEDLLSNIRGIIEVNVAFQQIQNQFGKWGKLFAQIKGELLSKERQRGLYGELTFLKTLLNRSSDKEDVVKSWTGPSGSNQDFSNELSAVEVKTSKATKPTVNIASELQLDWSILDSLFLYVFHIDELSNGNDTLMKLIEEIKEKISNENNIVRLFEDKLHQVGIPVGDEKLYDDFGFIIRSQRAYKVQNGFPALINDFINNDAIHSIKYQIELAACQSYEVNQEDVIRKMI